MIAPPAEFSLIARHFRPLAGPGALDLLDDAALLDPPPGRQLVLTADAMVEGVHFLPNDPPDTVGAKLLRVNLSDLAAMGAVPLTYLLTVSAPRDTPDAWFAGLAAGLLADQTHFGLTLSGGDTTSTPGPITLTITAIGHVAPGQALRRRGAQPGDEIWVTGTIGDGALGLLALQGKIPDPTGHLAARYRRPEPRLGLALHGIASACMDISDGLIQDLTHLCRAANCGATILSVQIPLSPAAKALGEKYLPTVLTGGDDYELLIAVPPVNTPNLPQTYPLTRIGHFTEGDIVQVHDPTGTPILLPQPGWSHF